MNFEDYFLSNLGADGNPKNPRLRGDFLIACKVLTAEALLILEDDDEFAPNPLSDLVIWSANSIISLRITAVEQEDKLTGLRRIIITLNFHFVNIETFELLVVEIEVSLGTRMRIPKLIFIVEIAIGE